MEGKMGQCQQQQPNNGATTAKQWSEVNKKPIKQGHYTKGGITRQAHNSLRPNNSSLLGGGGGESRFPGSLSSYEALVPSSRPLAPVPAQTLLSLPQARTQP